MSDLLHLNRVLTPAERRELFRKAGGYAARPGTGKPGETCGSCAHLFRNEMAKTYLKCALMRPFWTGGSGTDVKARSPACSKWEPR